MIDRGQGRAKLASMSTLLELSRALRACGDGYRVSIEITHGVSGGERFAVKSSKGTQLDSWSLVAVLDAVVRADAAAPDDDNTDGRGHAA